MLNVLGRSVSFINALVLALLERVIRSQEIQHNSLAVIISLLNRLLITLVPLNVGCALEIIWPRKIQNGFKYLCAFPGFEPDIALPTRPHNPKHARNFNRIKI